MCQTEQKQIQEVQVSKKRIPCHGLEYRSTLKCNTDTPLLTPRATTLREASTWDQSDTNTDRKVHNILGLI